MPSINPQYHIVIIASVDEQHECEYREMEYSIEKQNFAYCHLRATIFKYYPYKRKQVVRKLDNKYTGTQTLFIDVPGTSVWSDIFDEKTLTCFINTHVFSLEEGKAKKYFVITWGHAVGLGFFFEEKNTKGYINYFHNLDFGYKDKIKRDLNKYLTLLNNWSASLSLAYDAENFINFYFDSILDPLDNEKKPLNVSDFNSNLLFRLKVLSASSLNNIFSNSFLYNGVCIDLMICINCYTQLFETTFTFRKTVKNIIGTQNTMPFAGINYESFFEYINIPTNISEETLMTQITTYWAMKFFQKKPLAFCNLDYSKFSFFRHSLSGFSLSNPIADLDYSRFTDILSDVSDILRKYNRLALSARRKCADLSETNKLAYIDLGVFLLVFFDLLRESISKPGVASDIKVLALLISRFAIIRKNMLKAIVASPSLFYFRPSITTTTNFATPTDSPTFLSVFLPMPKKYISADYRKFIDWFMENVFPPNVSKLPLELQSSKWIQFVSYFYNL